MLPYNLINFIGWLLNLYSWVIIAAALITWVSPDPRNPIVQFLHRITEPAPVGSMMPTWGLFVVLETARATCSAPKISRSASVAPAKRGITFFGTISTCTGACGLTS